MATVACQTQTTGKSNILAYKRKYSKKYFEKTWREAMRQNVINVFQKKSIKKNLESESWARLIIWQPVVCSSEYISASGNCSLHPTCLCTLHLLYFLLIFAYPRSNLQSTHWGFAFLVPAGSSLTPPTPSPQHRLSRPGQVRKLHYLGSWSAGSSPHRESPQHPLGSRRRRGGPNKNTTGHPHSKQPTYWRPASVLRQTHGCPFTFWWWQTVLCDCHPLNFVIILSYIQKSLMA